MGNMATQANARARIKAVLASLNITNSEDEFLHLASDYLEGHADAFRPANVTTGLTNVEAQALADAGITPASHKALIKNAVAVASYKAALTLTALTCSEAAQRLGVTDSRIRQRIADRTLVATTAPNSKAHRLPIFQFIDKGELPGLQIVLKAIRPSAPVAQIVGFFSTPQPDLEDQNGDAMNPVSWLATGGDPELVADLAADI